MHLCDELVRDGRGAGDAVADLDREWDLAENLAHARESLAELGRVSEERGPGALVEDEVDRAATVNVFEPPSVSSV